MDPGSSPPLYPFTSGIFLSSPSQRPQRPQDALLRLLRLLFWDKVVDTSGKVP
ncbi:hypothetical protein FRC18_000697 [Serendipita sp. 400]|nr:hypothetical protein FRC18_000697 [Serendipita sp. 400]